jgi:hypothetical protein
MMRWILPKRNTTSRRTAPMRRTKFEGANGVPNESDEMLRRKAMMSYYCFFRYNRLMRNGL